MGWRVKATDILDGVLLRSVVRQAAYQCRADGSGLYLWEPTVEKARLMARHNLERIPWDPQLPERVSAARQAIIEKRPDQSALLAAPLTWHGEVRGVLAVYDADQSRSFRVRDAVMLQSLADMTASVCQHTEDLARMTTQFRVLHSIDMALTSSQELEEVLDLILERAAALVGAEHGSLRQLQPETGRLVLKAHFGEGWTAEKMAYTPRIGEGIARWVAEHRQPYLSPDVREDPLNVVLFEEMRSSISVPLLAGQGEGPLAESLLGVLLLESSHLAAFDQQDVELLEALAQEAVIAIQNATQHRKLRIEQEKRVAAEKWAVMGQATTALAHRINNLLGVIPVGAGEIQRTLEADQLTAGDRRWIGANLERIERNARYVLGMADALFKPFKSTEPVSALDVNRLLNEALEAADLPGDVEVVRGYAAELPTVRGSSLLVDCFLELITNARKAMADAAAPRLTLRTRHHRDDDGEWVVVTITDTGRGIAPQQMRDLWQIFKPSEEGLGFGLWWLRTFVERQGGAVTCRTQLGRGTTFSVRLPVGAGRRDES